MLDNNIEWPNKPTRITVSAVGAFFCFWGGGAGAILAISAGHPVIAGLLALGAFCGTITAVMTLSAK